MYSIICVSSFIGNVFFCSNFTAVSIAAVNTDSCRTGKAWHDRLFSVMLFLPTWRETRVEVKSSAWLADAAGSLSSCRRAADGDRHSCDL